MLPPNKPVWRVGTIGFGYDDWAGPFYPPGEKSAAFLRFYATQFDCVELDTTFHAAPPADRFRHWAESVPDGFKFAVKAPKAITHQTAPAAAGGPMLEFLRAARALGSRLGPIVVQFPPTLSADAFGPMETLLGTLPADIRFAVEFRHPSWDRPQTAEMLARHRCCWVAADFGETAVTPTVTTDFSFLRLVGRHERFTVYDREQADVRPRLKWWFDRLAKTDVGEHWVMANNDYAGYAIGTARRARTLAGAPPTLTPTSLFDSPART